MLELVALIIVIHVTYKQTDNFVAISGQVFISLPYLPVLIGWISL